VMRVLSTLEHGPYLLAFPCLSAYLALSIAHQRPDLVSGLVLAQAPSWADALRWKERMDPSGVLSTPVLGQVALRLARRRTAQNWYGLATGSVARRQELIATANAGFRNGAAFSLASAFQQFLRSGYTLQPVEHEALFVWGMRDRSHKGTDHQASLTLAPRGRVLESDTVGHFPELEDPAWFAGLLRDFAKR